MATLLVSSLVAILSAPPVVPEKEPPERPTSEELFEADLLAVESYTFEPKEVLTLSQVLKAVDLDHRCWHGSGATVVLSTYSHKCAGQIDDRPRVWSPGQPPDPKRR